MLALSPAVLSCFGMVGPLISRGHLEMYHNSGPSRSIFLATILDVAAVWTLLSLLLLAARRPGRLQVTVWSGLILMLPWLLLEEGTAVGEWTPAAWCGDAVFFLGMLCWVLVVLFWRQSFLGAFQRVQRIAEVTLAFAALSALLCLSQLAWCFWQARGLNQPRAMRQPTVAIRPVALAAKPKVVWILLDELSYEQVYERRFPGLELPAFDSLAEESTIFTHVIPAGLYTELVMPSLLAGVDFDAARASANGSTLRLHNPETDRWQSFDPAQTVFEDADERGYGTAISGWYNPYCRILPEELDRCFWTLHTSYPGNMQPDASVLSNALAPLSDLIDAALGMIRKSTKPVSVDLFRVRDYQQLMTAGDQFLTDPTVNFILLHMPVPHPRAIYDRRTGTVGAAGGSYVDNLALADRYLEHVCLLLKQRGEWDSSTILIMGDHSWRTQLLWASSRMWTAEDQAASHGGQFDDRPGYIVKLPHQKVPARIDAHFPAVKTRRMLVEIMDGKIQTPAELAEFAELESAGGR
jgi:hypothetical protein